MAETYVNTVGTLSQSSSPVYDDGAIYQAWGMPFTTGSSSYVLDEVIVVLQEEPTSTSTLTASIFEAGGNDLPTGSPISTAFTWGAIPQGTFGQVSFTPTASITLDADKTYVFTLSTAPGGDYRWQTTTDAVYVTTGGWSIPTPHVMAYLTNEFNNEIWAEGSGGSYYFQGAIEATAVPEPATVWLGLGALGVVMAIRARRSRQS